MTKKTIRTNLIKFFQQELARLQKNYDSAEGLVDKQGIKACIFYCEHLINSFINHKLDHIIKDK